MLTFYVLKQTVIITCGAGSVCQEEKVCVIKPYTLPWVFVVIMTLDVNLQCIVE